MADIFLQWCVGSSRQAVAGEGMGVFDDEILHEGRPFLSTHGHCLRAELEIAGP